MSSYIHLTNYNELQLPSCPKPDVSSYEGLMDDYPSLLPVTVPEVSHYIAALYYRIIVYKTESWPVSRNQVVYI